MKKIFFLITLSIYITTTYAQVPLEYTKNNHGADIVMTSKHFVIENYGNNFVTGNMVLYAIGNNNGSAPMLGIIFDDISSQERSKNLLSKEKTSISLIFEDNTTLSASASIRKGYGGFDPVCLDIMIRDLKKPQESFDSSIERNSRNISFLTSKNIKRIEFDGGSLNVRTEATSDPLLKSGNLIKSMFTELRNRYPDNPMLR